ncbi:hypothetical protein N825_06890 [Skermanella stibiiresistens SB22]|uniref:Uncharacterized protein n=1 Tax=Skermanella stibiiresistens SB22 TaxID=1385369 RepID=W9H3Y9_9PROT|nr:hypothetical protein N825_06890 [Skermanella stibiiresistens SB22]
MHALRRIGWEGTGRGRRDDLPIIVLTHGGWIDKNMR